MVVEYNDVVAGSFTGTGTSAAFVTQHGFNLSISGFGVATIQLQRSFDKGANWLVVEPFSADTERRVDDPGHDVYYRVEATAHDSGTILYRLSA